MAARTSQRTVTVVLVGAGLLFAGNGLFQTMLPIRAGLEAFSTQLIGVIGAAYFAGFILGCLVGPGLIKAVGHIRAYAGVVALFAAVTLLFTIWVSPDGWILLRVLTGLCLAVVVMAVESWLNDQATNTNRGRILSLYIIVTNTGWIAGQLGVNLADLLAPTLFILTAIVICFSVAPIALTPTDEPDPVPGARLYLRRLIALSPVGTIGCLLVGATEGAFWALGPLFGQQRGLQVLDVTLLMGAFILGGTLSQWPIGRLSDDHDRRIIILPVALATCATGLFIAWLNTLDQAAMLILATTHGALMIPIYSLCIAHVNDSAPADQFVQVSGGLLLLYSIGATLGPLIAAPMMESYGPGALFVFISATLALFGTIIVVRLTLVRRPVRAFPVRYRPSPRTTQSIYELEYDSEERDES